MVVVAVVSVVVVEVVVVVMVMVIVVVTVVTVVAAVAVVVVAVATAAVTVAAAAVVVVVVAAAAAVVVVVVVAVVVVVVVVVMVVVVVAAAVAVVLVVAVEVIKCLPIRGWLTDLFTYFTLLFSSACTDRRRGGTQLSVSSKVGGLEKGHTLSSEGVCHGVAPSFSCSSSRSPAGVLGVVCPEGGLVYRHTCDVSEPLDLLFDVL